MNPNVKRALFWAPRMLCILFALFLSLFAFDVFGEGVGLWEAILAFLIHLTPVYLVVIVLAISWKREWLGAALFAALAVLYAALTRGREHWSAYLLISGPLLLLAALFWLNWKRRAQLRTR